MTVLSSDLPLPNNVVQWGHEQLKLLGIPVACRQDLINFLVGRMVRGFFQAIDERAARPWVVQWYRVEQCADCLGSGWNEAEGTLCGCSFMRLNTTTPKPKPARKPPRRRRNRRQRRR